MDVRMIHRPRRNRVTPGIRALVRETQLTVDDLVWPCFLIEGKKKRIPVDSMPGCFRFSLDELVQEAQEAVQFGIKAIALFPALDDGVKDSVCQ